MRTLLPVSAFLLSASVVSAQMTPDQRTFDFQGISALYAKRYAPLDWKKQAFHFDPLNIKPWLQRVANAKDDLEFFEIEAEYVASLQDTHSHFSMTSSFAANLGISVDIYDGRVIIDGVNRGLLPASRFPFTIGDELVSVDGKTTDELIAGFNKLYAYGNPDSTRRLNASRIAARSQSVLPRAVELGDTAEVVIRRMSGAMETYTLPWTKSGREVRSVGPVPTPKSASPPRAAESDTPYLQALDEMHTWRISDRDPLMQPIGWGTDPDGNPRKFVSGVGARNPIFRGGLPASFVLRLGASGADSHFSGTYKAGDKTIGFLRIPSFSPVSTAAAVREFDAEINYFQNNTDGLVVDVMRNPGGGCYMLDVAARLIPSSFYFFGEQVRATQDRLDSLQFALDFAIAVRAPDWVIQTYQYYVARFAEALAANRGMTEPIPACSQFGSDWAPVIEGNQPAQNVYTKPLIVLVDAFSISAADIFPSMIQDNARAPLVGMRTSGGGGSVSGWPTGFYSESFATNTNSLVIRKQPIATADLPTAPYVENIGARPDIPLDFMTVENLLNGGRTFVDAFTAILLDQIAKSQ
jgi:C-terminal processing protease CtpA/Prc